MAQNLPAPSSLGRKVLKFSLFISIILAAIFPAVKAYSATTNAPVDLLAFFKQAISSPPDVEMYVVGQLNLQDRHNNKIVQSNVYQYYQGGRSGTNYYLGFLSNSNSGINSNQRGVIAGRSGASVYEISTNAVSRSIGINGLSTNVDVLFNLTRQFLDMGISEIEPTTVAWQDNGYTARTRTALARYGELEISNNLPFRLKMRVTKSSPPYKVIEYTYPEPIMLFSGFPARMLISTRNNDDDDLKPAVEIIFQRVQLAGQQLSEDFFSDARLATPGIRYTNIYSNSDLYVMNLKSKKLVKVPDSFLRSGAYTNAKTRMGIYICFALITAVPVIIFFGSRFKQTKQK